MRVPITAPLWQVRLAQAGLMPSAATMRMAALLHSMGREMDQQARGAEGNVRGRQSQEGAVGKPDPAA
jgi:hypothetical protein